MDSDRWPFMFSHLLAAAAIGAIILTAAMHAGERSLAERALTGQHDRAITLTGPLQDLAAAEGAVR